MADVERIDVSNARTETVQGRLISVRLRRRCEVPQGSSRRVDPIRPIRLVLLRSFGFVGLWYAPRSPARSAFFASTMGDIGREVSYGAAPGCNWTLVYIKEQTWHRVVTWRR